MRIMLHTLLFAIDLFGQYSSTTYLDDRLKLLAAKIRAKFVTKFRLTPQKAFNPSKYMASRFL